MDVLGLAVTNANTGLKLFAPTPVASIRTFVMRYVRATRMPPGGATGTPRNVMEDAPDPPPIPGKPLNLPAWLNVWPPSPTTWHATAGLRGERQGSWFPRGREAVPGLGSSTSTNASVTH